MSQTQVNIIPCPLNVLSNAHIFSQNNFKFQYLRYVESLSGIICDSEQNHIMHTKDFDFIYAQHNHLACKTKVY